MEAGKAAPDNGIARWWIAGSGKVATKPGDLQHIVMERSIFQSFRRSCSVDLVECGDLTGRQHLAWVAVGIGAGRHG